MKLSFVLFDEIEKASDALWNLLLGMLDKATLTLGDNRRVDFSHAIIFMTSNLGAAEMNAILHPKLGFAVVARQAGREAERRQDRATREWKRRAAGSRRSSSTASTRSWSSIRWARRTAADRGHRTGAVEQPDS